MVLASQLVGRVAIENDDTARSKLQMVAHAVDQTQRAMTVKLLGAANSASSALGGRLTSSLQSTSGGFLDFASKATIASAGLMGLVKGAASLAGAFFAPNASLEQMQVSFAAFIDDADQVKATMGDIKKFATTTPFETPEINKAALALLNMDVAAKDLTKWMGNIGAAVSKIGGSGQQFEDITQIIAQMGVEGKITTGEMMQLQERNIPAFKILAKTMGVSVSQLKQMISNSELGADKIELFVKALGEFGGDAMIEQSKTWNGMISTIKDTVRDVWVAFSGPLFDQARGAMFSFLTVVSSNQEAIMSFASGAGQGLANVFGAIGKAGVYVRNVLRSLPLLDLQQGLNAIGGLARDIAVRLGKLGEAFKILGTDADPVAEIIQDIGRVGLNFVTPLVYRFVDGLMSIDKALASGKNPLDGLKTTLQNIGKVFESPIFVKFSETMGNLGNALGGLARSAFDLWTILSPLGALFRGSGDAGQTFSNILTIATNIINNSIIPAINGLSQFINDLKPILEPIAKTIMEIFLMLFDWFVQNGPTLQSIGKQIFEGIANVVKTVGPPIANDLIPAVKDLLKAILPVISRVIDWIDKSGILKIVFGFLAEALKQVINGVTTAIKIVTFIINAFNWWNDTTDKVRNAIYAAFGGLGAFFSSVGEAMWSGIKQGINWIIDGINGFIGFMNNISISIPAISAGPIQIPAATFGLPDIPLIPKLAIGGLIGSAGFADVHKDERIFLPVGARVVPASHAQGMREKPQIVIQAPPIYLDGRLLASGLMPYVVDGIRHGTGNWGM